MENIVKDDKTPVPSFDVYSNKQIELPFYSNDINNLFCPNYITPNEVEAQSEFTFYKLKNKLFSNKAIINNSVSKTDEGSAETSEYSITSGDLASGHLTSGFTISYEPEPEPKSVTDLQNEPDQTAENQSKDISNAEQNIPNIPTHDTGNQQNTSIIPFSNKSISQSQKQKTNAACNPKLKIKSSDDSNNIFVQASKTHRKCILISTQGKYQPSLYVFKPDEHSPRIHFFYFENYTQSPFDLPPSNIKKYLEKQEENMAAKEKKLQNKTDEQKINYCEFCHHKVKNPSKHRTGKRHQAKFMAYNWKPLLEIEAKYAEKICLL